MAAPVDSNVQLPGGTQTGPQVRTLQLVAMDSGTPVTVQMQVIQIADDQGYVLGNTGTPEIHLAILAELRAIRRLLGARFGIFETIPDVLHAVATQQ